MNIFIDNASVRLDGRPARVICAANRSGTPASGISSRVASEDPIMEGADDFGAFLRFSTKAGDISANEAKAYAGRLDAAPRRAFITLEGMGKVPRWGERITQHFGLVVEPGPQIKPNLFCALAQENAWPLSDQGWKSPPMEFGIVTRNRMKEGKIVKDGKGVPVLDEYLALGAKILPDPTKQAVLAAEILSKTPLVRGAYNEIALAFADGRGLRGLLEFYRGSTPGGRTELQGSYAGPTGYPAFGSVYPAVGVYCHVGQVSPIVARIYGWRESPLS